MFATDTPITLRPWDVKYEAVSGESAVGELLRLHFDGELMRVVCSAPSITTFFEQYIDPADEFQWVKLTYEGVIVGYVLVMRDFTTELAPTAQRLYSEIKGIFCTEKEWERGLELLGAGFITFVDHACDEVSVRCRVPKKHINQEDFARAAFFLERAFRLHPASYQTVLIANYER